MEQKITIIDVEDFLDMFEFEDEDLEGEANSNYYRECF